jgi:hypothetical protein
MIRLRVSFKNLNFKLIAQGPDCIPPFLAAIDSHQKFSFKIRSAKDYLSQVACAKGAKISMEIRA